MYCLLFFCIFVGNNCTCVFHGYFNVMKAGGGRRNKGFVEKMFHRKGKNSRFKYYVLNVLRCLQPRFLLRPKIADLYDVVERRADKDLIYDRVNYYNRLTDRTPIPDREGTMVKDFHLKGHGSSYFFDTYEFLRYFDANQRFIPLFGDITYVPDLPSIVKSRPISSDGMNAFSVLLNLDKCRHFVFLNDTVPFERKEFKIIFRGECKGKPKRQAFVEKFRDNPLCDVADVCVYDENGGLKGFANMLSLYDHCRYKFIMSLEGNDVASNLKWVMSSNCIAVMPRPVYETWYMEGRLIPDYHYIEVKPDYSDLIEKTTWYAEHPDEANEIIEHAHQWVAQFKDKEREKLVSLMVLDKYFRHTK